MLEFTKLELIEFVNMIMKDLGYLEEFNIVEKTFQKLLMKIATNYNSNPYHTFTHVFGIFQVHTLQYSYNL